MPDREKVKKGLECCTFILGKRKCNECPYQKGLPDNGCYQLQDDFHALLKEQEAKNTGVWRHYEGVLTCSECNTAFKQEIMEMCGDNVPRFCPWCGAKMEGR